MYKILLTGTNPKLVNIDGADMLASKLAKSQFPEIVKPEDISNILELVENVDYDGAVDHINALLETLTK